MTKLKKMVSGWLKRQSRARQAIRELNALSDRDLADIGISRCDIDQVVWEGMP